ncbi:MAG: DUF1214 domain-containing protein [Hyphomicrobiaceae bacterium]
MATRIKLPTGLATLWRRIQSIIGLLIRIGVFLSIALVGGTASSWYAVETGMPFNTERDGPWIRWTGAGRVDSDPYTRNRFGRRRQLLYNANLSARYEASTDGKGRRLHSSCDYVVEGRRFEAPWWSLAVFDASGRLIPNAAQRYSFNSQTIAYSADGSFAVRMSREARPYNWLPTTRAGSLIVVFEVQSDSGGTDVLNRSAVRLPTIKRISCR